MVGGVVVGVAAGGVVVVMVVVVAVATAGAGAGAVAVAAAIAVAVPVAAAVTGGGQPQTPNQEQLWAVLVKVGLESMKMSSESDLVFSLPST